MSKKKPPDKLAAKTRCFLQVHYNITVVGMKSPKGSIMLGDVLFFT